ncbi:MAG: hypothetical protein RDU59_00980 [Thermodesulfobacteriota bacterium]|nr:hypothetical protein [Thermodesulfobacteriota bacterium]
MIDLRSFIFYGVVLDLSLLPMFHIFGFPYKIGLLTVGIVGLFTWHKQHARFLLFSFCGLIIACWIGAVYQSLFYPASSYDFTMYCTASILLCFLGYTFGYFNTPKSLNKILLVAFAVVTMNLIVGGLWDKLPFLIDFYDLNRAVEEGWIKDRNTGIFLNPNVSALGINILLLFIVLASRRGLFSRNMIFYMSMLWCMAFIALITLGSKSELLTFIVLSIFLLKDFNLAFFKRYILFVTVGCLIIFSFFIKHMDRTEVFKHGLWLFTNIHTVIIEQYIVPEIDYDVPGDRRVKFTRALEAFSYSPIWGSGFDRAEIGIFSEQTKIRYHNDWAYIFVAGGIMGGIFFLLILRKAWKTHPLLIVPFFFPGLTNSFMLTVQLFCLYGVLWGVLERDRIEKKFARQLSLKSAQAV